MEEIKEGSWAYCFGRSEIGEIERAWESSLEAWILCRNFFPNGEARTHDLQMSVQKREGKPKLAMSGSLATDLQKYEGAQYCHKNL